MSMPGWSQRRVASVVLCAHRRLPAGTPAQRTDATGRGSAAERLVRDPLAAVDRELPLRAAADEELVAPRAAVDRPLAEVRLDPVVARAGSDRVAAVARVDEVVAGPADDGVGLGRWLAGRLVVGPQDVAPRPGVDGVAAVAAEQLVMPGGVAHHEAVGGPHEAPLARAAQMDRVARVPRVGPGERVMTGARVERARAVGLVHQQHAVDLGPALVARAGG